MTQNKYETFEDLKARLDEIVAAVSDDTMPLDDALALYEEAVSLGLRATDLLEENIEQQHLDKTADNQVELAVDEATAGMADEQIDETTGETEEICEDTL